MREGDGDALDLLLPLVYAELRQIAHGQLAGKGQPLTLNTTAVVHEAYLKLMRSESAAPRDRGHFFAVAATAMRQIVIDHARARLAQKRGDGAQHQSLDDHEIAIDDRASELMDLDAALKRLEVMDARASKVVELRFFGGLTVEETAEALEIAPRTVKREWREARALLYRELRG
jgi:RNA polymerase sigma factor (TIGR02999 family)